MPKPVLNESTGPLVEALNWFVAHTSGLSPSVPNNKASTVALTSQQVKAPPHSIIRTWGMFVYILISSAYTNFAERFVQSWFTTTYCRWSHSVIFTKCSLYCTPSHGAPCRINCQAHWNCWSIQHLLKAAKLTLCSKSRTCSMLQVNQSKRNLISHCSPRLLSHPRFFFL